MDRAIRNVSQLGSYNHLLLALKKDEEFFMDFFVHNMLFHSDTVLSRRGMELSYSKWKWL